jgi:signal transduction histidine kinase
VISQNLSVATFLSVHKQDIVTQWIERIRQELPESRIHSAATLIDSLPRYIEEMVKCLESGNLPLNGDGAKLRAICMEHGHQRATLGNYSLNVVFSEYQVLRQILIHTLESNGLLDSLSRDILLDSIFHGFRGAAVAFVGLHMAKEEEARSALEDVASSLRLERDLREQFIATISHDLRGPLTAARASAEMALRYGHKEELRERMLRKTVESIDRAERMIRDLLDNSLIRGGKPLKLNLTQTFMDQIVTQLLDDMTTVYGERFVMTLEGPMDGVWDPDHVRRAVENLVINAVKYGSKTAPIKINVQAEEASGRISITVHNEGDPIPAEKLEHIFEPFYNSSTNNSWGLGLPIVNGIAHAHGGNVTIDSRPGGTAFTLTLPRDARLFLGT